MYRFKPMRMMRASNGSLCPTRRSAQDQRSRKVFSATSSATPYRCAVSVVMPCTRATSSGIVQPSGATIRSMPAIIARDSTSTRPAAICTMCGCCGASLGACQSGKPLVSVS